MNSPQSISSSQPQMVVFSDTNEESDPKLTIIQKISQENIPSTLTDATTLSIEVWCHIVSFFDDKTLLCFAQVCKQFRDVVNKQPAVTRVLALTKKEAHQLRKDHELAEFAFIMIALTETLLNRSDQAEMTTHALDRCYSNSTAAHYLIDEVLLIDRIILGDPDNIHSLRKQFTDKYGKKLRNEISLLQIRRLCKERRFKEAQEILIKIDNLDLGLQGMDCIALARAESGQLKESLEIYDSDADFIEEDSRIESFTREAKCKLFHQFARSGQTIDSILLLFNPDHETISKTLHQLKTLFHFGVIDFFSAMSLFAKTEMDNLRPENAEVLLDFSREFAAERLMLVVLAEIQKSAGLKFAAITTLKRALEWLDKVHEPVFSILTHIAILQFDLGLVEEAHSTLNRVKEGAQGNALMGEVDFLNKLAKAEKHLNQIEDAKKTLQKALELAKGTASLSAFRFLLENGNVTDAYEIAIKLSSDLSGQAMMDIFQYHIEHNEVEEAKAFLKKSPFSGLKLARAVTSLAQTELAMVDLNLALETLSLITVPVYRILALISLISPKNPFDFEFSENFEKRIEGRKQIDQNDDRFCDKDVGLHIEAMKKHLATKGNSISRASS